MDPLLAPRTPGQVRLQPNERRALLAFCLKYGDITATVLLETTLSTLSRAVAGCPVQPITRSHLLATLVRASDVLDPCPLDLDGHDAREHVR